MNQDFRDVDLDRTDLIAGPAQGRSVGQRIAVLEPSIFQLMKLRGQDRADRSGVNRSIGVAAGLAVDRAGIQASSAADALKRLLRLCVVEDGAASVVEQDDMELARAVAGMNACPQRVVGVHPLASSRARQRLQED